MSAAVTRPLLLDAIDEALKQQPLTPDAESRARMVLAFTAGFIRTQEPQLAEALDRVIRYVATPASPPALPPLCTDCAYHRMYGKFDCCGRSEVRDIVNGAPEACFRERGDHAGRCGTSAVFFVPKTAS